MRGSLLKKHERHALSKRQFNNIQWQLTQIENLREITVMVLQILGEVAVEMTELFSKTLEEAEELIYEKGMVITAREKQQIRELTYEYAETLNDILRLHRKKVFREFERHHYMLQGIDPKWHMLLPSEILDD